MMSKKYLGLLLLLALGTTLSTRAFAVTVANAGFNDQTGWTTANDATLAHPGGTAIWTWVTPVVSSVVVTSREDILPTEGTGLGLTYAGLDSFTQFVDIPTAEEYLFSIDANAVTGTGASGLRLIDGVFDIFAGSASSGNLTVSTSDGWETFTWLTALDAGLLQVGIRNKLAAVYSIAYDNFSITAVDGPDVPAVPVPAAVWLFGTALLGLVGFSKRRKAA